MIKILKSIIKRKITDFYETKLGTFYFKQKGYCPCCEEETFFIAKNSWLRDYFKCLVCGSLPRERALMLTIKNEYTNWSNLKIHESSPGERGHSKLLKEKARFYIQTHFYRDKALGTVINGFRNENLESQTFQDETFDLVITADVMEHIYNPAEAFREIHRTLKPGGAHILSVPLVNKHRSTQKWATMNPDGSPNFLYEPDWHGNPIDKQGSPVTFHWGYDIKDFISTCTGDECEIFFIDDLYYGIRAEYIEIIVARKTKDNA